MVKMHFGSEYVSFFYSAQYMRRIGACSRYGSASSHYVLLFYAKIAVNKIALQAWVASSHIVLLFYAYCA